MSLAYWLSSCSASSYRSSRRLSHATAPWRTRAGQAAGVAFIEGLEERRLMSATLRVTHDFNSPGPAGRTNAQGTLAWAAANAVSGDTILVTGEALRHGITLTQGDLLLTQQNLTIESEPGQPAATISGGGVSRIFEVASGASVTLSNLTLTGGNGRANNGRPESHPDRGGAAVVDAGGALTVNNCTITGNAVAQFGGGIENFGTLALTHTTLSGNSAANSG